MLSCGWFRSNVFQACHSSPDGYRAPTSRRKQREGLRVGLEQRLDVRVLLLQIDARPTAHRQEVRVVEADGATRSTVVSSSRTGPDYAEPPAGCAVGARLSEATERARPDAARVLRGALRRCLRRSSAPVARRVASCGSLKRCCRTIRTTSIWRLQHRRVQRREHDAVFARARCRWATAVVESAARGIADFVGSRRRAAPSRRSWNRDAQARHQDRRAFIDLPSTARSMAPTSMRQALGSAGRLLPKEAANH